MRHVNHAAALAVMLASAPLANAAAAPEYPAKPIRIIATTTPGSGPDIIARLIGQKLTEAWGQPVIVDPRPGASGMIGAEIAARAAPDGYTFMIATSQHAIVNAMYEKRTYDLIKDFAAVSLMASTPFLLVSNASVPASSIAELVALAKAKPGQLKYGSGGSGSPPHLSMEIFKTMTSIDILHVPYKGVTPALNDTVAGHVHVTFSVIPACIALVKAGKVKTLGITTAKRSALVPDVPAIAESVPGYEFIGWYSVVAPAKTPADIIAKTSAEVVKALKTAEFQERLAALGAEPLGTTPQALDRFIREQVEKMRRAVKDSGARPDS
jgi:tripartite-type tricarboxylate transporter receptor subunit TctC